MASVQEHTKTHGERYYKFTVYLGEKDGKKIRKNMNWTPPKTSSGKEMTEKAARELAEKTAYEWEQALLGGEYAAKIITLTELFKIWNEKHVIPNLALKTASEYRKQWRRIEPYIGLLKSDKITVLHINSMYNEFQKEGANLKTGGKKDVSHYHRLLSSMFNWAIKNGFMVKNPCEHVTKPKREKKPKVVLDFEQTQTLYRHFEAEPLEFQVQIFILLVTGIRKGELFGIKWGDLLSNGILRISRSISYVAGQKQTEKVTKTGDIRHIKLPESLLVLLNEYKQEQQERIENLGDLYIDYGYIFSQNNGQARHIDSINKKFKDFLRSCGFSEELVKGFHLHSLRDTFASLLLASGTDIRTVAGLMGHSQPTLTLNVYGQFLPSQCSAAADMFTPLLK